MSAYTEAGEQHVEAQEDVVVIDPEIEALIPSLKPDEQSKLRESIKTEGCRDPLVVWKGHNILLDGHNRYAICRDLGIQFKIAELDFPDKDHAMLWILRNQLGRRNLSDFQFKLLVGQEYELEKKLTPNPHGTNQHSEEVRGQSDLKPKKKTAEKIAEEHGISEKTVKRSDDLYGSHQAVKEVAPEVAQKLESGE
jgi:ParB-like chromosome segregation protein Spo0J